MASEDHYHIFQWHFIDLNRSNFHSYSQGIFLPLSFFASLILITALFLCAHFCRRRLKLLQATAAAVVTSPMPAHQWVVVDCTTPSMLPSSVAKSHSLVDAGIVEKRECCICLSLFEYSEKLKVLECEHAYHLSVWTGGSVHSLAALSAGCPYSKLVIICRNL